MSETVHYRGKLQFDTDGFNNCVKTAREILKKRGKEFDDHYSNEVEQLCDDYYDEYFYYPRTETLYKILSKTEHDLYEEIIKVETTNDPWVLEYELRYYNGGAGFTECLEEALDKLD